MADRPAFAGGDQNYLRDVQYADGSKLDVRASLHARFATSAIPFAEFCAGLVDWPERVDVLECGSGTGRFWENAATPRSAALTLTDLSAGMVQRAVGHARSNGFDRARGAQCDVQALPFGDAMFDIVVANHMLYHVPDPDRAIAELARVLRPGGTLLAATNGYGHMGEINDAIAEVFGDRREELYEVFGIDTGEVRLRARFDAVAWHAFVNDLVVDDPSAAVAYGLSFPPGEFADDAQAREFAAAIERRTVDGTLRVHTRAGAFVCTSRPRSRPLSRPLSRPRHIYDDADFLAGYRTLNRQVAGLPGAPEWPDMQALLPSVAGTDIVDLGCGFGWFGRWAVEHDARSVLGVDVSERMLEQAVTDTTSERIEYRRADLETIELPPARFHLAYSSLALHYVADLRRLFGEVARSLVAGGSFVFSVEHPILSAPSSQAFETSAAGRRVWPLDDYAVEGPRTRHWFVDGVVKYHRTIATYLNELVGVGFEIRRLDEWVPPAARAADSESDDRHRPWFLLVHAARSR